jgi:hypothetical protein
VEVQEDFFCLGGIQPAVLCDATPVRHIHSSLPRSHCRDPHDRRRLYNYLCQANGMNENFLINFPDFNYVTYSWRFGRMWDAGSASQRSKFGRGN